MRHRLHGLSIIVLAAMLLAWLGIAIVAEIRTYDPLDLNRDGKVTSSDALLAHRQELRIKARVLGLPDPFVTEGEKR